MKTLGENTQPALERSTSYSSSADASNEPNVAVISRMCFADDLGIGTTGRDVKLAKDFFRGSSGSSGDMVSTKASCFLLAMGGCSVKFDFNMTSSF